MLLKILLCFLCGIRGLGADSTQPHEDPPMLLLVSFDGFRADYLQRFPMPNLKLLYSQGVLVEELTNVFVTKTFPNHYSLMTGLYAESHGILASRMYDSTSNKTFVAGRDTDLMWWDTVKPLWLSAKDYGYKTATMMWPGSEVPNRTATYFSPYNFNTPFKDRLGNLTNWMLGNGEEKRVTFAALYWEEPDHSGHIFGPDNDTEMGKVLKEVDDNIGLLMSELKRVGLWGHINVVVTSDHGMTQCSAERLIRLDDCLHPNNYTLVDLSPVTAIRPRSDPETVFNLLKECHPNMKAYLKESIPDRFHYRNNKRIQPIILIADEGWIIVQRGGLPRLGEHGYDNSLPSMHPFLAATGPSFRQGHRIKSMHSVDVYPLMCHLLSIPPQPNNGTLTQARDLLTTQPWDVSLMIGLVVGVLLVLTLFTVVFILLGPRRRRSGPRPFQRLQLDEDDDDPLLE